MFLQEIRDMHKLVAEYQERTGSSAKIYAQTLRQKNEGWEKAAERQQQEIVSLSVTLHVILSSQNNRTDDGDYLGLFRNAYNDLATANPTDLDKVSDAVARLRKYTLSIGEELPKPVTA